MEDNGSRTRAYNGYNGHQIFQDLKQGTKKVGGVKKTILGLNKITADLEKRVKLREREFLEAIDRKTRRRKEIQKIRELYREKINKMAQTERQESAPKKTTSPGLRQGGKDKELKMGVVKRIKESRIIRKIEKEVMEEYDKHLCSLQGSLTTSKLDFESKKRELDRYEGSLAAFENFQRSIGGYEGKIASLNHKMVIEKEEHEKQISEKEEQIKLLKKNAYTKAGFGLLRGLGLTGVGLMIGLGISSKFLNKGLEGKVSQVKLPMVAAAGENLSDQVKFYVERGFYQNDRSFAYMKTASRPWNNGEAKSRSKYDNETYQESINQFCDFLSRKYEGVDKGRINKGIIEMVRKGEYNLEMGDNGELYFFKGLNLDDAKKKGRAVKLNVEKDLKKIDKWLQGNGELL